ncbi:MAG TPA: twin-arginine translocation signal domain-containing protein, partial [bacterium (Candidatus Stahlbacteria)]|nr:twin-arginine translocation signal domain-containing protein [Candidatus Stahlbacteria bacterium]
MPKIGSIELSGGNMAGISRRDFLKRMAMGGMMMPLMSRNLFKLFNQQVIVVIVQDQYSTSGSNINQSIVQIMIDEGIK